MDRKECANGLQLIKVAAIKLKGNFSALFMGALAMTTPLILVIFLGILMSILFATSWVLTLAVVLFVIFVAPLQLGYIKYFNNVLDGKQPRLSEVYSYIKFSPLTLRAIYIAGLLMIMYIIGGILWMVSAGFAISAFSMVMFFIQKFEYPRLRTSLMECAKKMMGNRLAMFSYKLIFYLIYMMLFVLAGLCLALIYKLLAENIIISWVVAVCSVIVFVFLYTMLTVYFHSSNQIFFEDVLSRDEKKRQRKVQTTTNSTSQVGENEVDKESSNKKEEKLDVQKESKTNKDLGTTTKKSTTKKSAKVSDKDVVNDVKKDTKENKNRVKK